MALGPWNAPPNFVGAMSAGASAGTALRGQDIAESEAGDRLTLAYQQLAAEERQRTEMAKQRMQAASAAMQLKQQQLSLLDQYRQGKLTVDAARAKTAQDALALKSRPQIHFGTQGEVLQMQPDGSVKELRPARKPADTATIREPVDPNQPFGATVTRKVSAEDAAARLKAAAPQPQAAPAPTGRSLFHPSTWFGTPAPSQGGISPAATPAPATPYAEGAIIRQKKSGKLFKVVNGVPVEVPGNSPSSDNDQEE